VQILKEYDEVSVELTGHTDSRSSGSYNQILSKKRSGAAKNYLINNGITSSRIKVTYMGENKLVNDCGDDVRCQELEHQKNRRVEFKLVGEGVRINSKEPVDIQVNYPENPDEPEM